MPPLRNQTASGSPSQPPSPPRKRRRTPTHLARHKIKCGICRHPHREAIEQEFLHWRSPESLARADCSAIYRHVYAIGLYAKRRRNLLPSLELIIEHAADIVPTA